MGYGSFWEALPKSIKKALIKQKYRKKGPSRETRSIKGKSQFRNKSSSVVRVILSDPTIRTVIAVVMMSLTYMALRSGGLM